MLPKLDTPTYRLTLPSTKKEIQYRPFLVKEQKLLMMAQESEDERQVIDTVGKLVSSCTFEKIDSDNSPLFDIEYVFLKIKYLGKLDKIISQLKKQNIILNFEDDLWSIKIL